LRRKEDFNIIVELEDKKVFLKALNEKSGMNTIRTALS
jgi:hypothetical protein